MDSAGGIPHEGAEDVVPQDSGNPDGAGSVRTGPEADVLHYGAEHIKSPGVLPGHQVVCRTEVQRQAQGNTVRRVDMTNKELIDGINGMIELAKKHHVEHYVIVCSMEDYPEIKAICHTDFPHIMVIGARAVEKGKLYLWDGNDEDWRLNCRAIYGRKDRGGLICLDSRVRE